MATATTESVEKDRIPAAVGYGRSTVEAERDAEELREKVWTRWSARLLLPVDPFEIAKDLGIRVLRGSEVAPDISGMLEKKAGYEDPAILLNGDDSRSRRRFTCAHELGHYTQSVKRDGGLGSSSTAGLLSRPRIWIR